MIALEAVLALKENFRQEYVIDFIKGRGTDDIVSHHHNELEEFGSGEDFNEKLWNPVIRQAMIAGYMKKDVENYGLLKVTQSGRRFIKSPHSFMVVMDTEFKDEYEDDDAQGAMAALDPELYEMLVSLRKKVAKRLGLAPYVIFFDQSLEQMATMYPVTLQELQNIQGVGAGKAKKYGAEFCDLIRRHCEEYGIERPEDIRVKTVAKNSMVKVKIIQSIDRQIALDDLASAMGLDFDELLDEIESIVYSGTKLNIDYFLRDVMDDDAIDDIFDYFMEADTDDLDTAVEELGGDYTDENIRLVRIKFISEVAN